MTAGVLARVTLTGRCVNSACSKAGKVQKIRYRRNGAGDLVLKRDTCKGCGARLR
jgi:hypothetical protein